MSLEWNLNVYYGDDINIISKKYLQGVLQAFWPLARIARFSTSCRRQSRGWRGRRSSRILGYRCVSDIQQSYARGHFCGKRDILIFVKLKYKTNYLNYIVKYSASLIPNPYPTSLLHFIFVSWLNSIIQNYSWKPVKLWRIYYKIFFWSYKIKSRNLTTITQIYHLIILN